MEQTDPQPRSGEDLLALARGFMDARVFLTALELGLFEELPGKEQTAQQIAESLDTDPRATGVLLSALVALGLLHERDARFSVPEEILPFLRPSGPPSARGALAHTAGAWDAWSALTETLRTGRPPGRVWSESRSLEFARAMQDHAKSAAGKIAALLDCSDAARMLDLGSGPGCYAIALLQRYPSLQAVLLDRDPQALRLAREALDAQRLDDRATLRQGSFLRDELGSDYDLVLMSSVVCLMGEAENRSLLHKVFASLSDGGRVVIHDTVHDDTAPPPREAALFAVHMLVNTPHGGVHTAAAIRAWLADAGFRDVHRLPAGSMSLLMGRKAKR